MGTEIKLDLGLYQEKIDQLRNAMNSVDPEISTSESFEITNIKPLTVDLENLIETLELVQTYKTLFNEDADTLEHLKETLQKQDETLAQRSTGFGPVMMR